LDRAYSAASIAVSARASARFCRGLNAAICFIQLRSAPAQKLAPAPAITTARTSAAWSSARSSAVSSAIRVALNALCTSGRLRTTMATALRTVTSSVL
jgi:hypothetical protein